MASNVFDPAFDIPHPVNQFPPAFDLTGVLPPAVQRYFTELASAGSQYYTIPEITLSGDFEIEWEMYASDFSNNDFAQNSLAVNDDRVNINPSGNFIYKADGAFNSFGEVVASQNLNSKLNLFKLTRIGSIVSLYINAGLIGAISSSDTLTLDNIGVANNNYADGIIANVRIKDNGVLVRSYNIDEDWVSSTVLNDSSGNDQHGAFINGTSADAQNYTFNGNVSPNTWTGDDATVIEVAGT